MSIINDALKKVQQGLPPKADQKGQTQNKIKSVLAFACATVITVVSAVYICQQFKINVPKAQTFAKKSFNNMVTKIKPLIPKPPEKPPVVVLKSLGQLNINPAAVNNPTAAKPAALTLDIHGIMFKKNGNLVLIDDQVYQEGDEVDGTKIVKIGLNSITVVNNGIEQKIPVKN